MRALMFDIDFDFVDFNDYKVVLIDLEKEGWEIQPPISAINEDTYDTTDMVSCYAIRKWE